METSDRKKRKKYAGFFFERALPNEYLVAIGKKNSKPILGGKRFKWFKKFVHVPAFVQRLKFSTDNANIHYQGIEIVGYASWRINPESPEKSISTLDFFDEHNPMEKTNEELKTICIEAVRHVIANMTIDDALKKKDDIAESLIIQLRTIENKWGIIFDQVGIEQVRIMSDSLFHNLQSEFRSKLQLSAEISDMETQREIARIKNETHEKNMKEKLETDQKLEMIRIENANIIKKKALIEEMNLNEQRQKIQEAEFRAQIAFKLEQEQKEHELLVLKNNLQTTINELDIRLFETTSNLEDIKSDIAAKQIQVKELQQKLDQSFSEDKLKYEFIKTLPQLFDSIKIDNYSVLDSGNDQVTSPVIKILNELLFSIKKFNLNNPKDSD